MTEGSMELLMGSRAVVATAHDQNIIGVLHKNAATLASSAGNPYW